MPNLNEKFLNTNNKKASLDFFNSICETWVDFKNQIEVKKKNISENDFNDYFSEFPKTALDENTILTEFKEKYLNYCTNFWSVNFMWFPDAWNWISWIWWAILSDFLQQNLINQSFCAPSATLMEINVIRWLREIVWYKNIDVKNNLDVWWMITVWWTVSNIIWILLARENKFPWTLEKWVYWLEKWLLVVPKWIWHYSVKSAQMLIWLWFNLLEVKTENYKYDLKELKEILEKHKWDIFWLVAYAWDSRTMTVDNFDDIYKLVKKIDKDIWLHADACHGFSLGLSESLRYKIKWIEKFDSVTWDPHKVFNIPYTLSMLLIKNPKNIKKVLTISDLIMNEWLALWQTTPFIWSKSWLSLKLWFFIKSLGSKLLDELITQRHNTAITFSKIIYKKSNFKLVNSPEINSVMFMYTWGGNYDIDKLNTINQKLYKLILEEWKYYIHIFPINDYIWNISKWKKIYPLRFMSWNPNIKTKDLEDFLSYIEILAHKIN